MWHGGHFTVIGPEADEVMAVLQIAMLAGLPYMALRDAIVAHPTSPKGSDCYF
jgi:pyruvate/2-oxoglutarate dehydrogenase complex dihydrolipoamide dehydrogenase (E3) component